MVSSVYDLNVVKAYKKIRKKRKKKKNEVTQGLFRIHASLFKLSRSFRFHNLTLRKTLGVGGGGWGGGTHSYMRNTSIMFSSSPSHFPPQISYHKRF